MKIGLFGGSFNPPHQGHVHVSRLALRSLQLDQLWWIVTPGNPLKNHNNLLALPERLAMCAQITTHRDIRITAFEAAYNLRYTADTLELLARRRATANFVWIMGADNFASFHHWDRWRDIANLVGLAVIDRPRTGPASGPSSHSNLATHALAKYRLDESDAGLVADLQPPVWTFIHGKRSYLSSTQIRNSSNESR